MPKLYPSSGAQRTKVGPAPKPIRVLVSAEHALVRAGIRALVERIAQVEVVAEAAGDRQSLELIKELKPEVVLLDISMPSVTALERLKEIVANCSPVRIIVLTLQENEEYAVLAFRAEQLDIFPKVRRVPSSKRR